MADAFGLGIAAAQQHQEKQQKGTAALAQVYSTMLQTEAALQQEQLRGWFSLQDRMMAEGGATERTAMTQAGENQRTAYTQGAMDKRSAFEQLQQNVRMQYQQQQETAREMFKQNAEDGRMRFRGMLDVRIEEYRARNAAALEVTRQQGTVFNNALEQGRSPLEAGALAQTAGRPLAQTAGVLAQFGPSPKAQQDLALAQSRLDTDASARQKNAFDMQLGAKQYALDVEKTGIDSRRADAYATGEYTQAVKVGAEGLQALMDVMVTNNPALRGNPEAQKAEAARFQQLDSLVVAQGNGQIDEATFQQEAAKTLAGSQIGLPMWRQYVGMQAMQTWSLSQAAAQYGNAVMAMPPDQLVAMHQQAPQETQGLVAGFLSRLVPFQNQARGVGAASSAPGEAELANAWMLAYRASGGDPKKMNEAWSAFEGAGHGTQIDILKRYASGIQDPQAKMAVEGVLENDDQMRYGAWQFLFGDGARLAQGQSMQGDVGFGGDLALTFGGGRLVKAVAPGVVGWMSRAPVVGGLVQKGAERVTGIYNRMGRPFGGRQPYQRAPLQDTGWPAAPGYPEGFPAKPFTPNSSYGQGIELYQGPHAISPIGTRSIPTVPGLPSLPGGPPPPPALPLGTPGAVFRSGWRPPPPPPPAGATPINAPRALPGPIPMRGYTPQTMNQQQWVNTLPRLNGGVDPNGQLLLFGR